MNTIIKYTILTALFFFGAAAVFAQTDQLERDIRIAERILGEIFTPQASERQLIGARTGSIHGEYIPGIGVHFNIPRNQYLIAARNDQRGSDQQELSEEDFEARVLEYISGYASQLRGLADEEQIRITYGRGSGGPAVMVFSGAERVERIARSGYTAWVGAGDVRQFAERGGSEADLRNRISIVNLAETEPKRDLDIFASVLETALNRAETNQLRVNRKPDYQYLPGLGATFNVTVNTGRGFSFSNISAQFDDLNFDNVDFQFQFREMHDSLPRYMTIQAPSVQINQDSLRVTIRKMVDSLRTDNEALRMEFEDLRRDAADKPSEISRMLNDSLRVHHEGLRIELENLRRNAAEAREAAMTGTRFELNFADRDTVDHSGDAAKIANELVTVMKDYATTLSSLNNGEMLMITLNWPGRNPSLPERTHIRIKKEDLLLGREPVMEEIRRR